VLFFFIKTNYYERDNTMSKTHTCSKPRPDFSPLADKWPSPYVSRSEVPRLTGGIINAKTLANCDSNGIGIADRIRVGRKIVYRVDALIAWLEARSELIGKGS
jgi:hypothetical protein